MVIGDEKEVIVDLEESAGTEIVYLMALQRQEPWKAKGEAGSVELAIV